MPKITQQEFDHAFSSGKVRYETDCERIQDVGLNMGLHMTLQQAEQIWEHYSSLRDAGWLILSDPSQARHAIQEFVSGPVEHW